MKKLLVLAFLVAIVAIADEHYTQGVDFFQYNRNNGDFGSYATSQTGLASPMITVKVKGGTTAYITNFVDDWYGGPIEDLGDSLYSLGYDMSDGKYGYVFAQIDEKGNATPTGGIHWADGTKAEITYTNPNYNKWDERAPETQTTTGYKLGTFDKDAEIFLVMTPNGYDSTHTSYELLSEYSEGNPTGLQSIFKSRQVNTWDQANSGRVNFAFGPINDPNNQGVSHEFVIGSVATPPQPVGSPLPGVCLSGLIFLGTATAARLRKRSRK
ncbi:MAG: hypothetical protein K5787_01940 [Lentisphaeria bacterium]|nr:hypothetical protein [Lentisphaeria bacterium]